LIQGGDSPRAWRQDSDGVVAPMDLFAPLADGSNLTAFDLQMPFLGWPDSRLTGITRMLGRPAYAFEFDPPAAFSADHPTIGSVRAYLDAEYGAPVETQIVGRDGQALKTLSLVDLKKVAGAWIVRDADVRDEATRDKTRFTVTAAALGLELPPSLFDPARTPGPIEAPASIVRF
jgi:hypothetical protein